MAGKLELVVSYAARRPWVPRRAQFEYWALAGLAARPRDSMRGDVLSIRVVGTARSRSLNAQYRNKDKPTNVLSFGGAGVTPDGLRHLGELVICAPLVAREATSQIRSLDAHWAHLTVHGVLHLLGFDHEHDGEARIMAAEEIQILDRLGFSNPYA